jgi:hypothetical protein
VRLRRTVIQALVPTARASSRSSATASSIGPPARASRIAVPESLAAKIRSGSGLRRE